MTEREEAAKLDRILVKVRGLLAHSEDEANPPEARASYLAKAKRLMDDYRIEEEGLIARDQFSILPMMREFTIIGYGDEMADWLGSLFTHSVMHIGAMPAMKWKYEDGRNHLVGQAFGYDSDLRYLDLLWSSIRFSFIGRLSPEYNPEESEAENIYRLRSSGIARKDVAQKIWGQWTHANSAKVGTVYKAECLRRGETPALQGKGIHLKDFRGVYAREFTYRVMDRLDAARDGVLGTSGETVLSGRFERIQELFWTAYPDRRPKPPTEEPIVVVCESGTPKKGRVAKPEQETRAYKEKVRRQYLSSAALAGAAAGQTAGDSVNLTRFAPKTGRVGAGSDAPEKALELEG